MDPQAVVQIEEIIRRRSLGQAFLAKRSKVFRAFSDVEQAAFQDGALPRKTKELVATAISVIKNCQSCMEWHIHEALKAGAGEQEVIEAIGVAIEMGGGPATVHARFAAEVLEYYTAREG
jgi:AhpD family alkylhydroperoxidase